MGALAMEKETGARAGVIVSRNPMTGEALGEVPELGADAVREAVARARRAQVDWARLSVRERCDRIGKFRDLVVGRASEICDLLARECGKPRPEALAHEVMTVADGATYFCKRAPEILAPHSITLHMLKHHGSYIHYVPRGVVGIISPWNFPFLLPIAEAVMAFIAGNAVVLKPSEVTPLIALKAKELFDAAGLPPDLFQVVTGRGPTGGALIDAGIDYCIFTGSTATGKKVAAACGERLIPCVLELGGKAPAIVCADAELERTSRALVWGAFANQGQVCASVERVYAHQAVHDELVERILKLTAEIRQGDPITGGEVDTGSMTWERQVEIVEERVAKAVEQGAKVRCGGKRLGKGLAFQPTVLTDCRHEMEIMHKEIFGPVMPIARVASEDEAVGLANDSHLGLSAYVFTADRRKGRRLAERVEAGTVMVNDVIYTAGLPEVPWGGIKHSGIGRSHSDAGLRDLCQERHVNYDRIAFKREAWWYPSSEKLYQRMLKSMHWIFR